MDYTVAGYADHRRDHRCFGVWSGFTCGHDFGGPWSLTWAAANVDRLASVNSSTPVCYSDYQWHRNGPDLAHPTDRREIFRLRPQHWTRRYSPTTTPA